MGNKCSIDTDPYFRDYLYSPKREPIGIALSLEHAILETKEWYVGVDETGCIVRRSKALIEQTLKDPIWFSWSPKSRMKDFEVIDPFTKQEIKIAKDQGIGVIILECARTYIKLIYQPEGIFPIISIWNHSLEAQQIMEKDLGIGYHLLIVDEDFKTSELMEPFVHQAVEKKDVLPKPLIWAPGLPQSLSGYDHHKEEESESEKEEENNTEPLSKKVKIENQTK